MEKTATKTFQPLPQTSWRLPCYPCPHDSICCSWGSYLSDAEAEAIVAKHGPEFVRKVDGDYRTAIVNDRCIFLSDNACGIHSEAYYPATCRCFPWTDSVDGGPYQGELTICPEIRDRGTDQLAGPNS